VSEADGCLITWTFQVQPNMQADILSDGKSTGATWSMAGDTEHTSGLAEMCPICIILLETAEGIELFAKYMSASIQVDSDGKGNVASSTGWKCGAAGEGKVPAFHEKPVSRRAALADIANESQEAGEY
jgi:hypothetical protein